MPAEAHQKQIDQQVQVVGDRHAAHAKAACQIGGIEQFR
jgi:hypothetical protein